MIATGSVLWTVKRKGLHTKPFFGLRLAEGLNIGAIACLPAGMAAFFLANRLLPAAMPGRADVEVSTLFWVWFGLAALSCLRPVRRAWAETLGLAGALFLAIPLVNAATTERGLPHSLLSGDTLFATFDLAMLVIGGLLAFASWAVATNAVPMRSTRRAARNAAPAAANETMQAADAA
jgi:hypothetical protein